MKKTIILILIIFLIINCQSDDDKLNKNDNKTSKSDITLKTFTLKLDKNYFLVNKEIKLNINYELEKKQDNNNLVLRVKSVGEDALKHQINGVDFVFGKTAVKEKQGFFDNVDGHMYLTPKKTGYLDLEFSGQLYDTVKKQYVGKPIVSAISMVSLKIDLSVSYSTLCTNVDVKFDDGGYETDNFLSPESEIVQGFDLTVIVNDNELKTTKSINLYEVTNIFKDKTSNVPKKIDVILKQRLTNGKINTFKFNDLEFKFKLKEVTLRSFDLKLDKNYFLVNEKIKINVNYEVENKEVNKNLVLRVSSVGKDTSKHQINRLDFVFDEPEFLHPVHDFFDVTDDYMYLTAIRTGYLDLELSGQLYDTVKKEYVGKPVVSKINFVSLKIEISLKIGFRNPLITSYSIIIKFSDGDFKTDNFLSNELDIVKGFDLILDINKDNIKVVNNINPYSKSVCKYVSGPPALGGEGGRDISRIDIDLLKKMTNGKVKKFTFKNVNFKI